MNLINLKCFSDFRGSLVAIESSNNIPFKIKRIFYVYGTKQNVTRANHAHLKQNEFLIALNGKCKVTLDDGSIKKTFTLNDPNVGLLKKSLTWVRIFDFSEDCVLLVVADGKYDLEDYITDYSEFISTITNDSKDK